MAACRTLTRNMLKEPIDVRLEGDALNFHHARQAADLKAAEVDESPMLLAWFDGKRGEYSPRVECCGEEKPAWLIYAESRGGNIIVDVNDEEYVFVYLGLARDLG